MFKKWNRLKQNIKELAPFISPYKWGFFGAIIMVVATNIIMALTPRIEGMITTQLAEDAKNIINKIEGAGVRFDIVIRILLILAACYIGKTLVQIVGIHLLTNAIQQAMHDLRIALQNKVHHIPVRYFDTNPFGDILSRITNDVDTVSNALQQSLTQVISGILSLGLALTMMFTIRWQIALAALLIIPAGILITRFIVKHSQSKFRAQQNALGALNGTITELYTGYNEILLYNKQQDAVKEFKRRNEHLQQNAFVAQFMSSLISPFISLVTYLTIGVIAVTGCFFVINGTMLVGDLQAFIRYIWQINDPLSQVSQLSTQIQSAFAALERIFEFLRAEEEIPDREKETITDTKKDTVVFDDVCFGYGKQQIIKNLNLSVKSGQMVAIVGPTGAGKTTIINLLLRFYDVQKGRILIDGVDIRDMKREELRSMFAMVLQDTWLFSGTIYDNIRYGRLSARKDEIIEAAKLAKVHHFIRTMPEGYDMVINEEGSNISQGEKQLLTIARAILKNPRILILDEATSSVDTRLEKMLQEAMSAIMKGRTSFVIAHRLSTIRNADLILVLNNGSIVEQGTHQELLEQGGYYKTLYYSQFAEK